MGKGWTKRNDVRLRREADHGADVLRLLPNQAEVEVLEQQPRFCKVLYHVGQEELTGYIASDFLEIEPESLAVNPRNAYLVPCPRCTAKNWGVFPLRITEGHGGRLGIPTGFLTIEPLGTRVCLHCGYAELCVERDCLPELHRLAKEST